MDAGGLAQMNYNNAAFMPSSFSGPTSGFASRGNRNTNMNRLSVAMPPKSSSPVSADGGTSPLPRATSRSHLLAGLRTAPKSPGLPASHTYHQLPGTTNHAQSHQTGFPSHMQNRAMPRSATLADLNQDQYALYTGQNLTSPDQVLAPPSIYGQQEEVDPNVLEQLQLTGQFLAQRQQQLQMQLANITAAASQLQGLNGYQQQLLVNSQQLQLQQQQQQMQMVDQAAQPSMQLMYDSATGQYQYIAAPQQQYLQRSNSPMGQSASMHNLSAASNTFEPSIPMFRAEISPPPMERPSHSNSRSDTPIEHVQPLPPPSANAFRRGHQKKNPSVSVASDKAGGLTRTTSINAFGPGGNRVGVHPIRQPRGPPGIEELIALPTANHEGSKNFAARRRRQALNNLVRAGSIRREASSSPAVSPTSESGLSLHSEAEEPGLYRRQSPIGSEVKQSSRSSLEGAGPNPASSKEKGSTFDMGHFVKQLPAHIRQPIQAQADSRRLLAANNLADKRRSVKF